MMRELFTNSFYACGTITAWAATLAAVRFFGQYAFGRDYSREVVVTGNTVTLGSPEKALLIATPATPANPSAQIMQTTADEYTVQCGNCKTPILSKPLRTELTEGGKARSIYKCEHCGATVGIKA